MKSVMHSHNKPFTYMFSLTLYSPPVDTPANVCCQWHSLYEIIHWTTKPCQYFFTLTTKCSPNVWTFDTQIMPTHFQWGFASITWGTEHKVVTVTSHMDWTWKYPRIHNTFRHKVSNWSLSQFAGGCTMSVWHA